MLQIDVERLALAEGIVDRFAHLTFGQVTACAFESDKEPLQSPVDDPALTGSIGKAKAGSGPLLSETLFNLIEMSDLPEDPVWHLWGFITGFPKFPADMGVTSSQKDRATMLPRKAIVGGATVTLEDALEVRWNQAFETFSTPGGVPLEEDIAGFQLFAAPEVALPGAAVVGTQVFDASFVDLDVALGKELALDLLIHRFEPISGQANPTRHGLSRDLQSVQEPIMAFLPVERQMAGKLIDKDLRQESWCCNAAFLQDWR